MKYWQNRHLITFLSLSVVLFFIFSEKNKVYIPLLFFLSTLPIYYYYSFQQLIHLSKYIKKHHYSFYEKNKSYRRYGKLNYLHVPIFGFIDSIKDLNDKKILDCSIDYKKSLNSMLYSLVLTILMVLILILA
jgi:hypothetical protein